MTKINKTSYAILGMLTIEPMSGYAIRQAIKQSTANFWSESDGQLYPALASLNEQGLLTYKVGLKSEGRDKKVYSITKKGTKELQQWLKQDPERQSVRNELMLKVFFGANVAPEVSCEHLQRAYLQTKTLLAELNKIKKELLTEHKKSPHLPYWLMSVEYGVYLAEAKIIWCEHAMSTLKKMR